MFIDDKLLELEDTDPIIENSRTLVPMRAIFETLGAEVDWDGTNKTAVVTKDGTTISLKIDDTIAYINDEPVELDVPARIKNSRTLVPVRFVAESLNADVTWDDALRAVLINTVSDIAEKEKNQIQNLVK
ncbi:MAG TPA: copper amine oxidase, partial [Clostridiales bacterium]|nr:copper amine oxidase [Clostridiales bacterium]